MLAALLPLILNLVPQIADWVFGAKTGTAAVGKIAAVVASVTGEDVTTVSGAAAAVAAIEGKPDLAAALRQQISDMHLAAQAEMDREAEAQRAADQADLVARLGDVASARAQTVTLAQDGSSIAWSAPAISVVVLATFGVVMALAFTRTIPVGSEQLLNVLLGSLAAMSTSVVSYWVGSSAGSAAKSAQIAELAKRP